MESKDNSLLEKNKWNLKDRPIAIIIGIIISTVTITYLITDKLLIEQYRLENARLEKLIDQQKTIDNLNEAVESLRNIMSQQNNLLDSMRMNQNLIIQSPSNDKITNSQLKKKIAKVNQLIEDGMKISKMNSGGNQTYDMFISWRSESLSYISSVDENFDFDYEKEFSNLTKLELSAYQEIPDKIKDGIIILNTIKHLLEYY